MSVRTRISAETKRVAEAAQKIGLHGYNLGIGGPRDVADRRSRSNQAEAQSSW